MAFNNVSLVYEYFADPEKSQAISEGDCYVGEPDLDANDIPQNQKQCYHRQEDGSDVPVSQPLNTGAGGVILINGSPAQIVVDGNYSMVVLDKSGAQKYYDANRYDGVPITEDTLSTVGLGAVNTIDDLRAYNVSALSGNERLYVSGYYAPGDGGGGVFYWNATSADTDDGGVTILPTGHTGPGRWKRIYSEFLDVRAYGAKGDGSTDDLAVIKLAVAGVNGLYFANTGSVYNVSNGIDFSNCDIQFETGAFLTLTQASTTGSVLGPQTNVTLINPQIDAGNLGHVTGQANGENGLGISQGQNVYVQGGHVKNAKRGTNDFGGKGVQVENAIQDVRVIGTLITNCSKGLNTQGTTTSIGKNILFSDIMVIDCWEIMQLDQFASPPDYGADDKGVVVNNVTARNCGIKDYASAVDTGAIVINRYANARVNGVTLINDSTYGTIPAFLMNHQGNTNEWFDLNFVGNCERVVYFENNASFGAGGDWKNNIVDVNHVGAATTLIDSATGAGASFFDGCHISVNSNDDASTIIGTGDIKDSTLSFADVRNLNNQKRLRGHFSTITGVGYTTLGALTNDDSAVDVDQRIANFQLLAAGATDNFSNLRDADVLLRRNESSRFILKSNTVNIPTIPASSAGLVTGDLWSNVNVITRVP